MFKTFARTIALRSVSEQNLQNIANQRLRQRGQVRCFSKPKKTKKMLRTWEFTQEARDCQQRQDSKQQQQQAAFRQYRLVSYNILAQDLLVEHYYLYQGINTQHLRWDHRLCCLKNELTYLDPDILCVQELQFNHVKEFVGRLSEKRKLEYIFKKKTGHRTDGCAIIYDKEKFKLVAEQDIEFYKPSLNNLNRENIALLAKFQLCHEPEKHIVIATTHLLYNPRRHDVRVAQVDLLLETLAKFSLKQSESTNSFFPVILTGDFNSESSSPPFNKLTSPYEIPGMYAPEETNEIKEQDSDDDCQIIEEASEVKEQAIDDDCQIIEEASEVKEQNSDDDCQIIEATNLNRAPLCFRLSAVDFGRSSASTYHERWIIVDYVLRSVEYDKKDSKEKSDVKVLSIYKLPTVRNCERIGKIPNQYLGSDHYLQAIEFIVV